MTCAHRDPAAADRKGPSPATRRILATLAASGNLAFDELARAALVGVATLTGGYLRRLRAAGLIHVSGWRRNRKGFTTPLYSVGGEADLAPPRVLAERRDWGALAAIAGVLRESGPLTCREVAIAASLSADRVKNRRYLDILVARGEAHVRAWRRDRRGDACAIYAPGRGVNVPPPGPITRRAARA